MTVLEIDEGILELLQIMARVEGHADIEALLLDYVDSWTRDRLGSDSFQR